MELKHCPYCGSNKIITNGEDDELGYYYYIIECENCGARTDKADDEEEAILLWNNRKEGL